MAGPSDIILEPNERVILTTRPLFLWEPLVLLEVLLIIGALYAAGQSATVGAWTNGLSLALLVVALLLFLWLFVRWIPWSRKWFVLTDRRVIARWGVLNRNQAALLLDRIQDASLTRPFPLSLLRGYGVLHLESAGEHAEERISGGLRQLAMTNSTAFYRALTDAQTPG
ncbi:MAG TPA: PH domain-containing protein [Candidatus Limnocylindria bacterium]|nr:PH domain-containing protein [Candidatus Limnocylindria bacterium]